ncbi:MAG TPA: CGNR zinc finger domain-containing protein [Nocardioidaceae bacterium]|nr:CGNR zinc finger domain-containing protein [Nocardioidaceae bacterium]
MAGRQETSADDSDFGESDADRALILDFANTLDVEASTDDLVTRAQLAEFLQRAGVVDGRAAASEQEVALARELRSGIRAAMHLNHDEVRGDVPELSRVLTRLPMRLGWTAGAPSLEPVESGVPGGLAQIAVAVANTHADGSWERLKICADSACEEAYYDASKNRSKNWCGPTCGNKAKTRAYRQRTKTARD